ncbi:terminase large subunit [Wenxinia saemankumensis]|uniref:Phage terminase-like protein, large subunit, contains N-terminal HTH domain n=1 Tax=Wenxinia saemankumensis TaxID=1447782 RepID=A0A1M6EZI2_9RHOB|nr:terminase large subunit [Wenxinia saemankumensis]SHI90840.1 Phage terminase-like protein, large subunit, contains N-terminal HTH domain [Wenxinia saemankumensis]
MTAPIRTDAWSTACPDWEDRLLNGRSMIPDLPLFDPVADKALRLFKRLRVPDMIGLPTYGEVCDEWVFDLVRAVFGSYDPVSRRRMIREFFVMIPKKNAKSAIGAAIIVVAAIMNERPDGELILISETQNIAGIAFRQAVGIIDADPNLAALFKPNAHLKQIEHRNNGTLIRILSADVKIATGSKAGFILVDESHVLGHQSKAADVYLELEGGLAARPEGFLLEITTQSKVQPHGEFKRRLDRARAVRDGSLALPILAVLYELPAEMQLEGAWKDEATWGLVNPNLERSVALDYLRDKFLAASTAGPDAMALFASQHLNVEIGVGMRADSWIGATLWAAAAAPERLSGYAALEALIARAEVATVGIDGGGLDDLLGLCVMGRDRETKDWWAWFRAWAQPEVLERRKEIAPLLHTFEADGDLTILPPDRPDGDVEEIAEIVGRLLDAGLLPEKAAAGLDPAGVAAIVDALDEVGIGEGQMVAIPQGYRLSPAIWGMERALKSRKVRHFGQPMMDWVLGNAKTEQRGSAVVVTKEAAGKAKIDPLVAGFNAFQLMARNPAAHVTGRIDDYFAAMRGAAA